MYYMQRRRKRRQMALLQIALEVARRVLDQIRETVCDCITTVVLLAFVFIGVPFFFYILSAMNVS